MCDCEILFEKTLFEIRLAIYVNRLRLAFSKRIWHIRLGISRPEPIVTPPDFYLGRETYGESARETKKSIDEGPSSQSLQVIGPVAGCCPVGGRCSRQTRRGNAIVPSHSLKLYAKCR
jgi:hypothetical protein